MCHASHGIQTTVLRALRERPQSTSTEEEPSWRHVMPILHVRGAHSCIIGSKDADISGCHLQPIRASIVPPCQGSPARDTLIASGLKCVASYIASKEKPTHGIAFCETLTTKQNRNLGCAHGVATNIPPQHAVPFLLLLSLYV